MDYVSGAGISQDELPGWLKKAAEHYGTFSDGRVNYTDAELAPALMCTVLCQDEILLMKRSHGLADANGYWSVVNGFIDEDRPVNELAANELLEELGWRADPNDIKVASSIQLKSQHEKRAYYIFPCLYQTDKKQPITLDYEHTEFKWIKRAELEKFHILDDLPLVVDSALKLL